MQALKNEAEHYIEKMKELKKNMKEIIEYACDGKNAEPYATLNHGDLWTLNMLFKYNEVSLFFVYFNFKTIKIHRENLTNLIVFKNNFLIQLKEII